VVAEGQLLADAKASELEALTWDDLDAYGSRVEYVAAPSGRTYRVRSAAFWDMDEWESDLYISVKAYAPRGFRRFWGYNAWKVRGGENLPQRPSKSISA
jgi:hypothetical protein